MIRKRDVCYDEVGIRKWGKSLSKEKKERKVTEEHLAIVRKLCPMDDTFFEVMMEDPDTCEELLQVFMENPKLRIIKDSVIGQKSIKIVGKRSIRVDAYAEGVEDEVFNIEIQKSDKDNHVKRVRYHASVITVNRSEPGDLFEDVQELYVIYVSRFDVLGNGRATSHAEMTCLETGEKIGDGLHEIYINSQYDDGSKIARLMKEFENPDMNNPEFPMTSRRVQQMKHDPEEVANMCEVIEEYAKKRADESRMEGHQEGRKEGRKEGRMVEIFLSVQEGDYSTSRGAQKLNVTEEEFCKQMKDAGYKIPVKQ